jgi:hypothetical protein
LRAVIVVLWRAGLRVQEALALAEHDLDRTGLPGTVTEWELPGGAFFDLAVIPVFQTATIERLRRGLRSDGRFEVPLRSNIVVSTGPDPEGPRGERLDRPHDRDRRRSPLADQWPLAAPGDDHAAAGGLPTGAAILGPAAQHNQASVGVYADVIAGGAISRDDRVTLA